MSPVIELYAPSTMSSSSPEDLDFTQRRCEEASGSPAKNTLSTTRRREKMMPFDRSRREMSKSNVQECHEGISAEYLSQYVQLHEDGLGVEGRESTSFNDGRWLMEVLRILDERDVEATGAGKRW
ncbi:uncharacterized protein ARMOST_20271 [Armillaria ostoyae]|uniref:Uncharacterized protein n=1 Tax=Armillaria ostoyae TaxID=47428 RepID=A0A284S6U6_ARMOS|nr:uncharacterized protein ARMOST_20271 [Armillaria ostoyae]